MRRRVTEWLDEHRLDDASYEEDHPHAAAFGRMGVANGGFIAWLVWFVLDTSGFHRRRRRRELTASEPEQQAAPWDG